MNENTAKKYTYGRSKRRYFIISGNFDFLEDSVISYEGELHRRKK